MGQNGVPSLSLFLFFPSANVATLALGARIFRAHDVRQNRDP